MKKIIFLILACVAAALWCGCGYACETAEGIPVQHHGRIKPFSAFAQETLQLISGKTRWHGQTATALFLANLDQPQQFLKIPFIRVDHPDLRKLIGLPAEGGHVSYQQLKPGWDTLMSLVQSANGRRQQDKRPSALEQQAEILYQRMAAVQSLSSGDSITVIPADEGAWASPYKVSGADADMFRKLVHDYALKAPAREQEVKSWILQADRSIRKGMQVRLRMETAYYQLQPFYYAWIFYLLGFVCLLWPRPLPQHAGKLLIAAGFIFHAAGILLRWMLLLRPPVANMYETMVFMDLVLMISVGVFVIIKKRTAFLSSGALVSALIMLYARLLPVDQSLDVVSPVLRSSYWLTVHVITIISSYSLFAFAMAVSHRHLFLSVRGRQTLQEEQLSADTIYRLLQAGLIALGAGTILGGVWANEAWGRFWGWDPKETWAFITFLGYMAILHLRYSRKLNNFALAVSGILGFLLVLMTWYGVNFVLGRGMHSYGSGSGGLTWIIYFLVFEACFLGFVFFKRGYKGKGI